MGNLSTAPIGKIEFSKDEAQGTFKLLGDQSPTLGMGRLSIGSITRTTIVVSNGRYTFYQIHFIKHNLSYTIYQIPFIKYLLSNTIYQIPFIQYLY